MRIPKFEKSAWHGIIGDDFTTENVSKVCRALGRWMIANDKATALLGHDTRFGGRMFANVAALTLQAEGITTTSSKNFITSPILILNMVKRNADIGIMITASSDDAKYSGIKIKGISSEKEIQEINDLIAESIDEVLPSFTIEDLIQEEDFEETYLDYLSSNIDLDSIKRSGIFVVFDAMYGATQSIYNKILPTSIKLRCEINPSFKDEIPHPIPQNLSLLSSLAGGTEYARCGFASNSDGEILAMCDEKGNFIDPYKLLENEENIPWRDGLMLALMVIEKMVKEDKQLSEFF